MSSMHREIAAKSFLLAFVLFLLCLGAASCTRRVHVTKQMTWECAPKEFNPAYFAKPDEYARFRFVEDPHHFELQSSKNFCAELEKAGRSIVIVDFEVWGKGKAVHGYRMHTVDGRPIRVRDVGGWGYSGANDEEGPSPIDDAFRFH